MKIIASMLVLCSLFGAIQAASPKYKCLKAVQNHVIDQFDSLPECEAGCDGQCVEMEAKAK